MERRKFIKAGSAALLGSLACAKSDLFNQDIRPGHIPRWRGFNLTEKFSPNNNRPFLESDFALVKELGFNFVRLPMSYWCWSSPTDWYSVDELVLKEIDQAIEWGKEYGIHVNLNFHRIPGYCVNGREKEPADLFRGPSEEKQKALDAACYHWELFAERYKDIPNRNLSFDLMNEPPWMDDEAPYVTVVRTLVETIREQDPNRLIFADGINIGQTPVFGIADLGLVQSTRGYLPKAVSHYQAGWVPQNEFETFNQPTWPLTDDKGIVWNREYLKQVLIDPWKKLESKGVSVHVGEWGAFTQTPHGVVLAWMEDLLSLWKEAGWGWAMWNLRGSFGILNSNRSDVVYESFQNDKLDRKMLELLQQY